MHRHFTLLTSRIRNAAPVLRRKETKFIGRLCTGDSSAWIQVLNDWSPRLYSYVVYNTIGEIEAKKLIHLILAEVVQTALRLPRPGNLTVLIFAIAYKHTLHYRRQNPAATPTLLQRSTPPTTIDPNKIDNAKIDNAKGVNFLHSFRQFSLEMQQVLLLRYLCGVTLPELSQIVEQPEETLTKLIQRAKFAY